MPLQTKDGDHEAKHLTAAELEDIFKKLLDVTKRTKANHPVWSKREDKPIIFSHDNATAFTAATLPDEGLGEVWRTEEIPAKSPDIHKLVEHPIHPIKAHFRKHFTQQLGKPSHARSMLLLEECVREAFLHYKVIEDCWTINDTLHSIINNGGDWADTPLR